MATQQYSPLNEKVEDLHDYDEAVSSNGCGCFRLFSFGVDRNNYEGRNLLQQNGREESWMVRKLKRVKEFSEMVAGPKWKTFIRKMGGYFKSKRQKNRFQYDPESYALNFDGGLNREEAGPPPLSFSARFAVPMAAKEQH